MKRLIAILAILVTISMQINAATYQPIYYPNAYDLSQYTRGPIFHSVEDARLWVRNKSGKPLNTSIGRASVGDYWEGERQDGWDYEIGINCRPYINDLQICEETVR